MTSNLVFDTLNYAQTLEDGGVEHAEIHATSLSAAIIQNIYTKEETDKMMEAILKQIEQNRYESEKRFQQERADYKQDMLEMRQETWRIQRDVERQINRSFHSVVSILGALIVAVGTASTLAHYFIH